ncbi:ATP-binding cassette domain-containing protein [Bradyrhizobium sp. INPA01-394B]|uniref:ATP-binding cassette domain-containing protein n=1 Tax=Bradyrhizobium campsiandrae TaxID=1729892 RepID=A0ABR7U5A1_9BRAD|nr:oligopeptide/dipeptide ABC transporter ATP-binding protein [Bradyrhizobium campsiandrae]MBC9879902.1 ATP-binding cassette domain-containing protein [Bradyrhizobium campsiandrae]MBC9978587.1 ATP-binding cassette domain-containing protein [Bradyrhizobium campsiandrae]
MSESALLEVISLKKHFPRPRTGFGPREVVKAVDDVSFTVARGETLSIVGESGCGKSTLGRTVLGLTPPSAGAVWFDGWRVDGLAKPQLRRIRRHFQVIFQDPMASLSPRMRIGDILAEPLINFGIVEGRKAVDARVGELLEMVGLPREASTRFAHEFSGGQRQRICIARALAPEPSLIVCDEAVSALDVSVKAQIVNLLASLQDRLGLSLLFISHDLAIVGYLTHRIAVMYLGVVVEIGDRDLVLDRPMHPYTRALISAVPKTRGETSRRIVLAGDVPSPINPPMGCRFHTRCPKAFDRCKVEEPKLRSVGTPRRLVACHLGISEQHASTEG